MRSSLNPIFVIAYVIYLLQLYQADVGQEKTLSVDLTECGVCEKELAGFFHINAFRGLCQNVESSKQFII